MAALKENGAAGTRGGRVVEYGSSMMGLEEPCDPVSERGFSRVWQDMTRRPHDYVQVKEYATTASSIDGYVSILLLHSAAATAQTIDKTEMAFVFHDDCGNQKLCHLQRTILNLPSVCCGNDSESFVVVVAYSACAEPLFLRTSNSRSCGGRSKPQPQSVGIPPIQIVPDQQLLSDESEAILVQRLGRHIRDFRLKRGRRATPALHPEQHASDKIPPNPPSAVRLADR